ncbi:LysR family transcriptional regulator [Limimaricola pyoseonensis]|uniref:DNA-binding transcriptional regulator, LysR family n=1 Tax=Limimaricola pyoseonensis TaxID=521013 RepID=A0A1G7JKT7_9RHOB|nr:LysR family transcriptional regulator [Limimaricola pyoseonensis]SDF25550.1 DNA-binding transcriptional regulator, LysR family [Limimaricola pyoseonensis]
MAIKIEMLRCFCAVVQQGSLNEAANQLGRTPSAVSMMLKQFEEHVGAALFETARKSRLTPLGGMIYGEARREIEHFGRTVEAIEGLSRAEAGQVRLAVTPSVATAILPAVIRHFRRDHPKVRIDMRDMDSASVQRELESERADIGLASIAAAPGFERKLLFSDPFGVVCTPGDALAARGDAVGWDDLAGRDFIANGLCRLIEDAAFAPILDGALMSVPNTASLLALVRGGVGLTLLPRRAVPRDDEGLAFLPLAESEARRHLYLVSQPRRLLPPAARAFLRVLETETADLRDAA